MSDPVEVSGFRDSVGCGDRRMALVNLSAVRVRMDSLQRFLSESVSRKAVLSRDRMKMVSSELVSAIQDTIFNGAALLDCAPPASLSQKSTEPSVLDPSDPVTSLPAKTERVDGEPIGDMECGQIVEIDEIELLAEYLHFCDICGKGFKRDANLRMHMRAHGNRFRTPQALAKPAEVGGRSGGSVVTAPSATRFSCPFRGCRRNRLHGKFRPLKSLICAKNHFKRSHCPKVYSCGLCQRKKFSVPADLGSHLRQCGESRWRCSCGTCFSRKDKLLGHAALFPGHVPAFAELDQEAKVVEIGDDDDADDKDENDVESMMKAPKQVCEGSIEESGGIDGFELQDMLGSPPGLDEVYDFL